MRKAGLQGVRRGKSVPTTTPDSSVPCPLDRVNRVFKADRPNQLWVSDFTYVNTWQGWLYVAFVIDVFALRIMGWRVSRNMQTDFVLDVLEPALYDRRPAANDLIHHSDRGSQYVSRHQTVGRQQRRFLRQRTGRNHQRAVQGGVDSPPGTLENRESVELSTLLWVHWFNHVRLLKPIGGIPPAEAEANYWKQLAAASTTTEVST
jgi:transposase InsO family protein